MSRSVCCTRCSATIPAEEVPQAVRRGRGTPVCQQESAHMHHPTSSFPDGRPWQPKLEQDLLDPQS